MLKRKDNAPDPRARARVTMRQPRPIQQAGKPLVAMRTRGLKEPAVCERCFAVYRDRTWRIGGPSRRVPADANWTLCPSCSQVEQQEYFGRVRVTRPLEPERESELRRRIWNVERRARATQPERRLVAMGRTPGGLEVLTTSQKLAHRIARELEKAFGGRASYTWAERDGLLDARWDPEGRSRDATPRTRRHAKG